MSAGWRLISARKCGGPITAVARRTRQTIWEVVVKFVKFLLVVFAMMGMLFVGLVTLALTLPSTSNSSTTRVIAPAAAPTVAASPTPVPDFQAAQALDPRKLIADPKAYRGSNRAVWYRNRARNGLSRSPA